MSAVALEHNSNLCVWRNVDISALQLTEYVKKLSSSGRIEVRSRGARRLFKRSSNLKILSSTMDAIFATLQRKKRKRRKRQTKRNRRKKRITIEKGKKEEEEQI